MTGSKRSLELLPISLVQTCRFFHSLLYAGSRRECPLCGGRFRKFLSAGVTRRRPDARCPRCNSHERHRLLWLFLRDRLPRPGAPDSAILHFAPEPCLVGRLRAAYGERYLTADIASPLAMRKMDIMAIDLPDESFDWILCSHVLEHVQDDSRALRELWRVLKAGGRAIVQVPITARSTIEGAATLTAGERARDFGHPEHLRAYGLDFAGRAEAAGFQVQVLDYAKTLAPQMRERCALVARGEEAEKIFFCSKGATAVSHP